MGHRHEQVGATLKRAIQQVLARGLGDPRTEGAMITVTDLKIAPDLKIATVLVSIYPDARARLAMHALRHAAPHIRHEVGDLVALKSMPQIVFELDAALKKQVEVLQALAKVEQERQARAASGQPADPASPADTSPDDPPGDRGETGRPEHTRE